MAGITSGRTEPCNNNIGGLKNIYLFDYVDYRSYLIETSLNTLVLYPATTIFKYELLADGNSLTDDLQDEETGQSYTQSLSIVLKGLRSDAQQINSLINKRVGCIVENRLGQFQIIGLYNGCIVKSVKGQTGGSRTDFSGYNLDLEAKEKSNVFYIDDLESAGFTIPTAETFFFQDNTNFIFQDNTNFIFQ